jgi:hypothetical protein
VQTFVLGVGFLGFVGFGLIFLTGMGEEADGDLSSSPI